MLHKTISFCSLAGVCLCVAGLLLDSVGADCENKKPLAAPCLAESEWTTCARSSDATDDWAFAECGGRDSKYPSSWPNTEKQDSQNSKTEPQSEDVTCYTVKKCEWVREYPGGPYNCYQKLEEPTTVSKTVTVYVDAGPCGE